MIAADARDDLNQADAAVPTVLRADFVLYTQLQTCIIGDNCGTNCISLYDDAGTAVVNFAKNGNLAVVAPGDPRIASAMRAQCLDLRLDAAEVAILHANAQQLATDIGAWTGGTLAVDVQIHEVTGAHELNIYNAEAPFVDPANLPAAARSQLSAASDFVFVTNEMRDDATGLHLAMPFCSLRYGLDVGAAGAAYGWLPRSMSFTFFECASADGYRGHFLTMLHDAMRAFTTFDDLYDGAYPACGAGDPDSTRWFPNPGECLVDPDWTLCGSTPCSEQFDRHVMEQHWVRDRVTTGNHCRNGLMDFNETAVDMGANCY